MTGAVDWGYVRSPSLKQHPGFIAAYLYNSEEGAGSVFLNYLKRERPGHM